jgi:glucose/arabinose dehydrogenase/mono/diheme cytochrome c family protein
MKSSFIKAGLMAFSGLVFACAAPQNSASDQVHVRPDFNPTPTPAYLSPAESMKTIHVPPGYRLELVASEPMIKEPVAIVWDGNARMYVAEMITYMQDADATGEQLPQSRISLLEDTDLDGKMDKSTVFIPNLLLPRMMQVIGDELLVNETNTITMHSYRDTNGDGVADVKKLIYKNDKYVLQDANMEHQRSGLDYNLDNWMYMTYDPIRVRYAKGTLLIDTLVSGTYGQWGVTHDNYGRLFFSSAGGENPVQGMQINPVYGRLDFSDQISAEFQEVWPIIATPDVQGGFKRLRPNVTLNHFTASCGQSIYRGDRLPQNLVGDYIICEPVARIIRRAKVLNLKGKTVLQNAYYRQEFISSSDMNFRPVNTASGPDGNLYIVDMHRGIIQQGNWTRPGSFLRQRIDSLGLAKNVGHGRIYRLVHEGYKASPKPQMLTAPATQLINYLSHANGWWRDNAQKQLIYLGDKSVVPALKQLVTKPAAGSDEYAALARLHALWTLEGLEALDKDIITTALKDADAQVRRTAVLLSEPYLKQADNGLLAPVAGLQNDPSYDVRVQLLLSLYKVNAPLAKTTVTALLENNKENEMITATKKALDKNEDVRTFGRRLGNMAAADREVIQKGATTFKTLCASCHGADGKGLAMGGSMPAPPLAGSKRLVLAEKNAAIRIVMHGLTGPVDGKAYASIMPAMGHNNDEWLASVVSYLRYEFGNSNRPRPGQNIVVTPVEIKKIRTAEANRKNAWTLAELEKKSKEELALAEAAASADSKTQK